MENCNTSKYAWYMNKECKRIVMLTNLLRMNPSLFQKHIHLQTDSIHLHTSILNKRIFKRINGYISVETKMLNPSFNLYLADQIHSLCAGLTDQIGRQNLTERLRLTLNFNQVYGENCIYGYFGTYESVIGWITSAGHYSNLVHPAYYKIGVSKFWPKSYQISYVQVFSSKKWRALCRS